MSDHEKCVTHLPMTAIQPARLRDQVSNLIVHYKNSNKFVRELHDLLDLYGRHAYRPGKTGNPAILLPSYRTPEPVLRQIELELNPLLESDAQSGIALCDALWNESYYEFKLLAARIIGKVPEEFLEEALSRISGWSSQVKDKSLSDALFTRGLVNIITKDPDRIINQAHKWLNSSQQAEKLFGMQIILATLENKNFSNIPLIFNILAPFVRKAPLFLRSHITEILNNLGQRTPKETAFFLQQNLELSIDQDTAWFIRRSLYVFPSETQSSLRSAIRKQEKPINKKQ